MCSCKCFGDICNLKIKKPSWTVEEKKMCALREESNKGRKKVEDSDGAEEQQRVTGGQGE